MEEGRREHASAGWHCEKDGACLAAAARASEDESGDQQAGQDLHRGVGDVGARQWVGAVQQHTVEQAGDHCGEHERNQARRRPTGQRADAGQSAEQCGPHPAGGHGKECRGYVSEVVVVDQCSGHRREAGTQSHQRVPGSGERDRGDVEPDWCGPEPRAARDDHGHREPEDFPEM
jgi:hypothetical protein